MILKVLWLMIALFTISILVNLRNLDYFAQKVSVDVSGVIDEECRPAEELYEVNDKINPILNALKQTKFFRIFKANLETNNCPFWDDEGSCMSNKCSVGQCEQDEVPDAWRQCETTYDVERTLNSSEQTMIDNFIFRPGPTEWMKIEEHDKDAVFVNLANNAESMTFYNGTHIWDAIYRENCMSLSLRNYCKEDRILYKLISGVHANINMHISHFDYDLDGNLLEPNYSRYYERVGSQEEYLKNMLFAYSFALQAINHLSDKVDGFNLILEHHENEVECRDYLKDMLVELIDESTQSCREPFKESNMLELMNEKQFIDTIKPIFYNITRILDCVTCEKCRLHGKLQFTGMTAVMKIMFGTNNEAKLTRNELVGLINLMAKLSNSIKWYREWLEIEKTQNFNSQLVYLGLVVICLLYNYAMAKWVFRPRKPKIVVSEPKKND